MEKCDEMRGRRRKQKHDCAPHTHTRMRTLDPPPVPHDPHGLSSAHRRRSPRQRKHHPPFPSPNLPPSLASSYITGDRRSLSLAPESLTRPSPRGRARRRRMSRPAPPDPSGPHLDFILHTNRPGMTQGIIADADATRAGGHATAPELGIGHVEEVASGLSQAASHWRSRAGSTNA